MNMMVSYNKMAKFKMNKIYKMNLSKDKIWKMMQKYKIANPCKIQNLEDIAIVRKRLSYWTMNCN